MKNFGKNSLTTAVVASLALGLAGPLTALAFASPATVDLGTAANFVILGKTTITTTGATAITGDLGISPAAASFITGFGLVADASNAFSTSALVTGKIFAANYVPPTPAYMTTAISDMEAAYTSAAGRTADSTNLGAGTLSSTTAAFAPGVYKWTTNVTITSDITLTGSATDIWIFQIAGTLTTAAAGSIPSGTHILLTGGAVAKNVFWAVAGATTLGTYSTFNGTILDQTNIALQTGTVLNGRALAQTAVTLDANTVTTTGATPATLRVVKLLVLGNGSQTTVPSNFTLSVKNASSSNVAGSPLAGVGAPGSPFTLSAGTYTVSEAANASYGQAFTGACNSNGTVTLAAGEDKTCTIVNTSNAVAIQSGGRIVPLIGILKVPTPLALPGGSGPVTYSYTVWNVGGHDALTNVSIEGDTCSPIVLLSGDVNNNKKLDPGEIWKFSCTTTLAKTTTNTAVATGYSDDSFKQAAIATAVATVVVGAPLIPPLINIVKVPSRLTPFPFGGGNVTYAYIVTNPGVVAMNNVVVTDDKCSPVSRNFNDANLNGNNNNGLLEPGESWSYTCKSNITASTRNVATAEGRANGFIALGYSFATVLVSTPGLPNTGFPPRETSAWDIVMLSFALVLVLASRAVVLRKRRI